MAKPARKKVLDKDFTEQLQTQIKEYVTHMETKERAFKTKMLITVGVFGVIVIVFFILLLLQDNSDLHFILG